MRCQRLGPALAHERLRARLAGLELGLHQSPQRQRAYLEHQQRGQLLGRHASLAT